MCVSELSLSSHSSYGGLYADSAERRNLLPLVDWQEKEAVAAADKWRAQRTGSDSSTSSTGGGSGSGSVSNRRSTGKQCSGASGERLQLGGSVDPSLHSFVQRSWLPDRQHFDHYCAERVDVWNSVAQRDKQRDESSRLTRRGQPGGAEEQGSRRASTLTSAHSPNDEQFDRTLHAFTTAPAFAPIVNNV